MSLIAPALARSLWLGLSLCLPLWIGMPVARAETSALWQEDAQRLRVGLKLFPACLGALESLDDVLAQNDSLRVLVVYEGSDAPARQAVSSLETIDRIRGHPLRASILSARELDQGSGGLAAGIFIASVGLDPRRLRTWSERYRILVFSPFAGAVEEGAVAGIYVADRILPHINIAQARRAHIRFKPFFLQVARQYQDD
ncbi:hypothetical protein [Thiocystis violascens]|uniref:Uncharacterized protein n=1 Tax=Thiocystis violascens (strain ATCC 17096 / DSM 198 / 6111) TaxID=765911 RepID=I3YBS2_THIV6|nr:hypothetical protein [Thiocystis violascens]AFL74440.1 hypothetical protein Thivi_2502 [Thiocystis violascens DSM 198]